MQVADLARGTFGFVQLAEDLTTGEHLAIKVQLAPGAWPELCMLCSVVRHPCP